MPNFVCTLCGFDLIWMGYELRCENCNSFHGTRDTVRLVPVITPQEREFHAALRDAYKVLICSVQRRADKVDDTLRQVYIESTEQAEESDGIAAGAEHHQQWLHDILKRMEVRESNE